MERFFKKNCLNKFINKNIYNCILEIVLCDLIFLIIVKRIKSDRIVVGI